MRYAQAPKYSTRPSSMIRRTSRTVLHWNIRLSGSACRGFPDVRGRFSTQSSVSEIALHGILKSVDPVSGVGNPQQIAVLGLGYVGCVTAACLAHVGHRVVGVDRDQFKVDTVRAGRAPFFEQVSKMWSAMVSRPDVSPLPSPCAKHWPAPMSR